MPYPKGTPEIFRQRFFSRIEYDTNGGCWLWSRKLDPDGYGWFVMGSEQRAHRSSWQLFKGEIPHGLAVCHRCDVRACVNPTHLFLGTSQDNNRDRHDKGRTACGERLKHAILTESMVSDIRIQRASGASVKVIADRYGVRAATIYDITSGRSWAHSSPTAREPNPPTPANQGNT